MFQEKKLRILTLFHRHCPLSEVDIFLRGIIPFSELEGKAFVARVSDFGVPVVSKEHLIGLKRISGRLQDLADIEALEHTEELDSKNER